MGGTARINSARAAESASRVFLECFGTAARLSKTAALLRNRNFAKNGRKKASWNLDPHPRRRRGLSLIERARRIRDSSLRSRMTQALGAGVTPAEGSVKPTAGFTFNQVASSISACARAINFNLVNKINPHINENAAQNITAVRGLKCSPM